MVTITDARGSTLTDSTPGAFLRLPWVDRTADDVADETHRINAVNDVNGHHHQLASEWPWR
jgi:hypothetical protein